MTVPGTVTVAAGTTTATFSATAAATIPRNQSASVTATLGTSTQTASVNLQAPVLISGVACNPTTLGQGAMSTCTVALTSAAPAGATIMLASNNNLLTVPASVTVAVSGASLPGLRQPPSTNAAFSATTVSVSTSSQVTSGDAIAVGLYWTASQTLTSITGCGSTSFAIVNNPTGPGASLVRFAQAYGFATTSGACTVTATFSGAVASAAMVVNDVQNVTALDCFAAQEQDVPGTGSNAVSGGGCTTTASGDYLLGVLTNGDGNGATFTAGTNFKLEGPTSMSIQTEDALQTSAGLATATATVTPGYASTATGLLAFKAASATTATFTATAAATISANQTATVTATLGTSTQTAGINLIELPPVLPGLRQPPSRNNAFSAKSVSVSTASPVTSGDAIAVGLYWTASQTLTSITGCGSTSFMIVNNPTGPGTSLVRFAQAYGFATTSGACTVEATFSGSVASTAMVVNDIQNVAALDCFAAQEQNVPGTGSNAVSSGRCTTTASGDYLLSVLTNGDGNGATFTAGTSFKLEGPATMSIQTEDAIQTSAGLVSATATVTPGYASTATGLLAFKAASASTATFTTTAPISANQSAKAVAIGAPGPFGALTSVSSLQCSPTVVIAGSAVSCELNLTAVSQSVAIALTSSSAAVHVPAMVTTRPSQSSLTFLAQTDPTSRQQQVVITSSLGESMAEASIVVMAAPSPILSAPKQLVGKAGAALSFKVSAADSTDLPLNIESAALPAGATFNAGTGVFDWAPQLSQQGKYQVTFSASNAAGQTSSAQTELDVDSGIPLLNAPSQSCSPGALSTLTGKWLASPGSILSDLSGASFDLGGTKVFVEGQSVPVVKASADRIEFVCPLTAIGNQVTLFAESVFGTSRPVSMGAQEVTPTLLSLDDSAQGLISFLETTDLVMARNYRVRAHPAQAGDQIVIYATGLGPDAAAGSAAMTVQLGDVPVSVDAIEPVPGWLGVYAVKVQTPSAVTFGVVPVQLRMITPDGRQFISNSVSAEFEPIRR